MEASHNISKLGHSSKPKESETYGDEFVEARALIFDVPYVDTITDGYIDDAITIVVNHEDWVEKSTNAALLFTLYLDL